MSLINKALQQEQRRRAINYDTCPPMVARAMRRGNDRGVIALVAFAGIGFVLAGGVAAFLYFGSSYLGDAKIAVSSPTDTDREPPVAYASGPAAETAASVASSANPVSSVKQMMLAEKAAAVQEIVDEATAAEPIATQETSIAAPATEPDAALIAERVRLQGIVDGYSIQGVRLLGKDSRVFLNGKIQKLGDAIDLANGITLVDATTGQVVFEDKTGFRYTKNY